MLAALGIGEPGMATAEGAPAAGGLDVGALVAQVVGGGVGGAILTLIVGVIKSMMAKQDRRPAQGRRPAATCPQDLPPGWRVGCGRRDGDAVASQRVKAFDPAAPIVTSQRCPRPDGGAAPAVLRTLDLAS